MEQNHPNHMYRTITEQIAAAIAAGAPRFEMPWHRQGTGNGLPVNALTGSAYNGINIVALWVAAQLRGFTSSMWATYRQWAELKCQVRKGEKGTVIVFYRKVESTQPETGGEGEEPEVRLVARAFWVFNANQVDNWRDPEPDEVSAFERIERAETFIRTVGAEIHEGWADACYFPHADYIQMPPRSAFVGSATSDPAEAYYATLLHELTHWTGHKSRLDRNFAKPFGDEAYAMEELVAELGAAFLCARLGITNEPRPDHAAYVNSWLRVLGNDRRAIFIAAGKATAAVEYLEKHHGDECR
jgi:antirestriction protein ArdC